VPVTTTAEAAPSIFSSSFVARRSARDITESRHIPGIVAGTLLRGQTTTTSREAVDTRRTPSSWSPCAASSVKRAHQPRATRSSRSASTSAASHWRSLESDDGDDDEEWEGWRRTHHVDVVACLDEIEVGQGSSEHGLKLERHYMLREEGR
jgi:hypothetical protein